MKNNKLFLLSAVSLAATIILSACANDGENSANQQNGNSNSNVEESNGGHGDHSGMDMSGSGEVPEGLKVAENPMFEVGNKAIITDAHMPGMENAEATIVGAFETTVYTISYDPTDGGERVEDHKWIIHEEIKNAQENPYEPGAEIEVDAEHMGGMNGAVAVIDSAEETTVYMVDFTLTSSGEEVTNHKWVTESELSKKE